jgi:hypothetical protein
MVCGQRAARIAARCILGATISGERKVPCCAGSQFAFRRADPLRHGIHLSYWFAQAIGGQYTKEHFDGYDTAQDIALIKGMGFDHVWFTLNCEPMFRRGQADHIPPDDLATVDAAVKMIVDQGLAIIIDIHPERDFKAKLAADDGRGPNRKAAEPRGSRWRGRIGAPWRDGRYERTRREISTQYTSLTRSVFCRELPIASGPCTIF